MPIIRAVGQTEDQLELGRLDDGHVGWFLALENAADIDANLAVSSPCCSLHSS